MYNFKIEVKQDYKIAESIFPKVPFNFIYKPMTSNVYTALISLMRIKLKKFNPIYKNKEIIVNQLFNNKKEAIFEKEQLELFLFGNMSEFNNKQEVKNILANRTIKNLIKNYKDKLLNKFTDEGQVITFLNKCSIYINYKVVNKKEKI